MKCKHECELMNEVQHARNRETRHLAEIGEMAREICNLKDDIRGLKYAVELLTDKGASCSNG